MYEFLALDNLLIRHESNTCADKHIWIVFEPNHSHANRPAN